VAPTKGETVKGTEREYKAVSLLADLLRRANMAVDAFCRDITTSTTLTYSAKDLRDELVPTLQIFREDVERITGEAIRLQLIHESNGIEQFPVESEKAGAA
jgi:hypothetical protein